MSKKALILYWHGLGDVIQLTPHLRHIYNKGYKIDLMSRFEVKDSHLLDNCPYINQLYSIPNPWQAKMGFKSQAQMNIGLFKHFAKEYDWSGMSLHKGLKGSTKIDVTAKELGIKLKDKSLEVYIPQNIVTSVSKYINKHYPNGFIFQHTYIENHKYHSWDASNWIKQKFPNIPIYNTQKQGFLNNNINYTFVLAAKAKVRVISSSVFIHACDAMNVPIEYANYGRPARYALPLDKNKLIHIREKGKWIK